MSIGTFGAFTQARLAIYAAQTGISVTGNNISNVNTPGYTRQRLNQVSLYTAGADRYYAEGDIRTGQGALVKSLSQIRNPYLDIRFREENNKVGYYDAYSSGLQSIKSVLDETGKGDASKGEDGFGILGLDISKLYEALQNINDQTGHQEYDDGVRGVAESLVTKLHSYAAKLEQIRTDTIMEFNEDVDAVNNCLTAIREYNEEIRKCEIYGDPALELRDARNNKIDELSSLIDLNVVYSEEVITGGLTVEKLSIYLGNANPDDAVETDESLLVDGIYCAQLIMGKPEINPDYIAKKAQLDQDLADGNITEDEYNEGLEKLPGMYLKKNGDATNDIRLANTLTDEDNPNYDFMISALKDKEGHRLKIVEKTPQTTVDKADTIGGAIDLTGVPAENILNQYGVQVTGATTVADLFKNPMNKTATVTVSDYPDRGDTTVLTYTKEKNAKGEDVYSLQQFRKLESRPVALDDNDLGGKLQAQRELLTEEGVFIDRDVIANIDENAGSKRGIGYYQKVLDLLANEFANTLNEANQGFLHDKNGNYMAPVLDVNGDPVLDKDGYPKGEFVVVPGLKDADGNPVPVNKNWDSMETAAQDAIAQEVGFADAADMLGQGVTGKQALDAFMKDQTWDDGTSSFTPANKEDIYDKDGNLVSAGWASGNPRGVFVGGPLFSNANDSNDTDKITASNINVSAAWSKSSLLVRSFECIDGTVEVASGQSDNLTHLKYLVGEKKVDFIPNQLDSSPNASDKVCFNGTFFEMWNNIGGTLGKDQKQAEDLLDTYYQSALSIDMDRDSVSSVDFNDEAMNLMMYAKSYNAACRLMTTIDSVLDKLINNTGMTT